MALNSTIGEWLVGLLEDINYFGTILPRIPKKIEDSIKVKVQLVLVLLKRPRAKTWAHERITWPGHAL